MQSRLKSIARVAVSFQIALALCLSPLLTYSTAYAEVLDSDIVIGKTVSERNLAVAKRPSITAYSAYLMDSEGRVYFERNANEHVQIASVTKVMTAMIALEHGDLNDIVTVSEDAAEVGGSSADLREGDTLTLENALKALLVPSGNDAAVAIAEHIGAKLIAQGADFGTEATPEDPVEAFVIMMNEKAAELGCVDTLYTNPHGLDYDEYEGCYSTAHDQALINAAAMKNEVFRSIANTPSAIEIPITRDGETTTIELEPTDTLFEVFDYCIGIKTGNTDAAGPCYAGAMSYEGFEAYAIVLNAASESDRFYDAMNLFEWLIAHRKECKYLASSVTTTMTLNGEQAEVPVLAEVAHEGWVDKTFKATVSDPTGSFYAIDVAGNISLKVSYDSISGTVHAGDKVGTVEYIQQNQVVATQDLIAAEDCYGPNVFEAVGVFIDRAIRQIRGESTVALTTEVYSPEYLNLKNATA